jgi:predicted ATPase
LALYDPAFPSAATWPVHAQNFAGFFSFRSLVYLGFLDRADRRRKEQIALARQRNHAHTLAMLLTNSLGVDVHIDHDPATLLTRADEVLALCAEHSLPYWAAVTAWLRGWCLSGLGHSEEAVALMTAALGDYRATGSVTVVPWFLTLIAEVLRKTRRAHEGLEKLDEAIRQIEATDERWSEADTHRVRGDLLADVGDVVEAEKSLYRAISVARRQSGKLFELRATTSLARLWRDQGKCHEARDLLAPIYGWFSEGFDTPVLKKAEALLDALA